MGKEQDANKRYYFRELDPSQVSEVLSKLISESAEVFLWRKGQTKEKMEHFHVVGVGGNTIQIKGKGLFANLARSENENEEVFIKICLKTKQFFTNSYLYVGDGGDYRLDIREVVFEGLRRKDYRLNSSKRISIKIKIGEESYDCNDISAGGVSLIIEEKFAKPFVKNSLFEDCTITLNRVSYPVVEGKVVGRWDIKEENKEENDEEEPKVKVALTFTDMKEKINENLCVHINSEAREEEILKELAAKKKAS